MHVCSLYQNDKSTKSSSSCLWRYHDIYTVLCLKSWGRFLTNTLLWSAIPLGRHFISFAVWRVFESIDGLFYRLLMFSKVKFVRQIWVFGEKVCSCEFVILVFMLLHRWLMEVNFEEDTFVKVTANPKSYTCAPFIIIHRKETIFYHLTQFFLSFFERKPYPMRRYMVKYRVNPIISRARIPE